MNNIELTKDFDPGNGRIRKKGQLMRVDPQTKQRLIKSGIAKDYKEKLEIIDADKPDFIKETAEEVKPKKESSKGVKKSD